MSKLSCRIPVKSIDTPIQKQFEEIGISYTLQQVANLREIHDRQHKDAIRNWIGSEEDFEALCALRASLLDKDASDTFDMDKILETFESFSSITESFLEIRKNFSLEEKTEIIKDLATLFQLAVTTASIKHGKTRKEIIEGTKAKDGTIIGGPSSLFQSVVYYLEVMKVRGLNGNPAITQHINTILQHKEALFTSVIKEIYSREGVKIRRDLSYATSINSEILNEDELKFDPEESTKEAWQERKDQRNLYSLSSPEIRAELSSIPSGERSKLGLPKYFDPIIVNDRLKALFKGITSASEMMEKLKELSDNDPNYASLYKKLNDPKNSILKTQIYIHFSTDYQRYSDRYVDKRTGRRIFRIINFLTNKRLYSKWIHDAETAQLAVTPDNIYDITDGSDTTVFHVENAVSLVEYLEEQLSKIKNAKSNIENNTNILGRLEALAKARKFQAEHLNEALNRVFSALGILVDDNTKSAYDIDIIHTINLLNDFVTYLNKAIADGKMQVQGLKFKHVIEKKYGKGDNATSLSEMISKILRIAANNNLITNSTDRIRYQGNTYFSSVLPSYMGRLFNKFKNVMYGRNSFIQKEFLNNPFFVSKDGTILHRWLRDAVSGNSNFLYDVIWSRYLGDDTQKYEDLNEQDQMTAILDAYFGSSRSGYRGFPTFILGDSNVSKIIEAPIYSIDEIAEEFYNVYQQEKILSGTITAYTEHLKQNDQSLGSLQSIKEDRFGLLTFLNQKKYRDMLDENNIKESFKKALQEYMNDNFEKFLTYLETLGIDVQNFNITDSGKVISIDYNALRNFYWNFKFFQVMQMELFTISPIFYQNGNSVDLQKRFKEIHASGKILDVEEMEHEYQRTMIFHEIELRKEEAEFAYKQLLKVVEHHFGKDSEIYKEYLKIKATDGQSYRTLKSYRDLMIGSGQWSEDAQHAYEEIESIRKKIKRTGEITKEQSRRLNKLLVVFQPVKPFLYTKESVNLQDGKVLQIPVQYKCAEIVVIPELLPKGSKLADMIYYAEEKDVDVLCASSSIKVGSFGEVAIKDSKNVQELRGELEKGVIHYWSYEDYVIQNNTPEHVRESRLFGTQSRKIVLGGLKDVDESGNMIDYSPYLGGVKTFSLGKGKQKYHANAYGISRLYVSCICQNILEDCQKTISKLEDADKVRELLINMSHTQDRVAEDHILGFMGTENTTEEFLLPLFEGGIKQESLSFLISEFRKQVNKQKIHGGSAVQASAFGINGYEESKGLQFVADPNNEGNILYAECEIAWDLAHKDSYGRDIPLDFDDWCNPDGTLKLSKEETTSTDYLSYKGKDGKSYIPLIEKKYPGILNIIAYRIPTEDKYSMLNMRVVRFTRKIDGGGVLKVPDAGTTIAGFDFDIDKLYLIRREYKFEGSLDVKKAWDDFYSYLSHAEPSIYNELEARWREHKGAVGKFLDNLGFYVTGIKKYELGDDLEIAEKFSEWIKGKEEKYGLKLDKYDFNKAPWEQSRTARNNLVIQLIQKRLEDPDTITDRLTPGGFKHAIEAMNEINKLRGINLESLDFSEPETLVIFNQQNQIAGKLIGIFANHNANHNMVSFFREFALKKGQEIKFGDHTKKGLGNFLNSTSLIKELLAASVDAVKQPVLNYLNITSLTATSAAMLTRLGFSFKEIGLLLNQPIIRELCKYCENNNIRSLSSGVTRFIASKRWQNINAANIVFDTAKLKEGLNKTEVSPTVNKALLELMQDIATKAHALSLIVKGTKFTAANSIGSTAGELYMSIINAQRLSEEQGKEEFPIIISMDREFGSKQDKVIDTFSTIPSSEDSEEYLQKVMTSPIGYEQVMFDAMNSLMGALNKYFPYFNNRYSNLVKSLESMLDYYDESTINGILDAVVPYMLEQDPHSPFNPNAILRYNDGREISAKEYYTRAVPQMLESLLIAMPQLKKNIALLRNLDKTIIEYKEIVRTEKKIMGKIITSEEEITRTRPVFNLKKEGQIGPIEEQAIRESWEAMYFSDDPTLKKLAEDLYFYSYHMSGFGFGSVGFNHLAPTSMKLALKVNSTTTYRTFLQKHLNETSALDQNSFFLHYILNNPYDSSFVFTPKSKTQKDVITKLIKDSNTEEEFIMPAEEKGFSSVRGKFRIYKPAIMVDGKLYIASPIDPAMADDVQRPFNVTTSKDATGMRYVLYDIENFETKQPQATGREDIEYLDSGETPTIEDIITDLLKSINGKNSTILKEAFGIIGGKGTIYYTSAEIDNFRDANGAKFCK